MIPFKLLGTTVALALSSTFGGTFPSATITFSDSSYQQRQVDTIYINNSNWESHVTCFIDISRASYFDQNNNATYFIFGLAFNFEAYSNKRLDYIEINLTANGNNYLRLTGTMPLYTSEDKELNLLNLRSNINVFLGYDYDSMGYSPRTSETNATDRGIIKDQVKSFTATKTGLSYKYQSDLYMNSEYLSYKYYDSILLVLDYPGQVTDPLMTPSINGNILVEVAKTTLFKPVYPQNTLINYNHI